jgi:Family of unknown function (DUF6297)
MPDRPETESLTAREIRRYTFRAGLVRTEGGIGELISEVYTSVLGAVVLVVMAAAVIAGLRDSLGLGSTPVWAASALAPGFQSLPPMQASATVLLTLAAALLSVEMNIGPIALSVPQTFWWLGLPVPRRGFILPGFLRSALWPVIAAVAVVVPLAFGSAGEAGPLQVLLSAVCGMGLALLLYGIAAWLQILGRGRWVRRVAGIVVLVAPLSLVVTALVGTVAGRPVDLEWLQYLPTSWPLLVAQGSVAPLLLLIAAAAVLVLVYTNLERLSSSRLKASAVAGSHVAGSVLSMDAGELTRALGSADTAVPTRIRLPLVFTGGSPARRSMLTLLSAQLTVQLRHPARLLRVLVLATLPASVAAVQFLGNAPLLAVVVYLAALFGVTGMGHVARFAAGNPSVDALLPLPQVTVRRVHLLGPAAGLTLWMAVAFTLLLILGVGSWPLVLLGVLAGPGLGAATLRAAFRPAPDWTMPPVATAAGPIPVGAIRNFLVGPDLTLITLLPVLVCLASGGVPLLAFPVQLALTALAIVWGTHVRRPATTRSGASTPAVAPSTGQRR